MGWAVGGISVFPLPSPQDVPTIQWNVRVGTRKKPGKTTSLAGARGALDVCPSVCRRQACAKEPPAPLMEKRTGSTARRPLVFRCHGEGVTLLWTNARICTALPFLGTSCSPAVFHLQESSFPVGHWFHSKRPEPCLLQARVSWPPGWTREFLGGAAFNLLRNIHHPV